MSIRSVCAEARIFRRLCLILIPLSPLQQFKESQ